MDLDEALVRRRACREYLPEPVGADLVAKLVDAAERASTGRTSPIAT